MYKWFRGRSQGYSTINPSPGHDCAGHPEETPESQIWSRSQSVNQSTTPSSNHPGLMRSLITDHQRQLPSTLTEEVGDYSQEGPAKLTVSWLQPQTSLRGLCLVMHSECGAAPPAVMLLMRSPHSVCTRCGAHASIACPNPSRPPAPQPHVYASPLRVTNAA